MKKAFSFFIILFALVSCSEDVQFNNVAVFQGVRNNEFWQGTDAVATVTPTTMTISAIYGTETITLKVPLPSRTVDPKNDKTFITYELGAANRKATYTIENEDGELIYETRLGEDDGQVVISEFDGAFVSGTFRFNAYNTADEADEDDLVNLQNGVVYKVAITTPATVN